MSKQFLVIVIITFLTVGAWVVFDVLHTKSQVVITPETQKLIQPVNPNIELDDLN